MRQLGTCALCKGFLGIAVRACPHCGAELGRARKVFAGLSMLVGGGAISTTLMACYGGGCIEDDCSYNPTDRDADVDARTRADAQVGSEDGGLDGASDAAVDARSDGGDASFDAPSDAPTDG